MLSSTVSPPRMNTPPEEEVEPQPIPFGLLELDTDWTVIYFKPDGGKGDGGSNEIERARDACVLLRTCGSMGVLPHLLSRIKNQKEKIVANSERTLCVA